MSVAQLLRRGVGLNVANCFDWLEYDYIILHHQVTGHDQAVLESYVKFVTTAARALDIEMAKW